MKAPIFIRPLTEDEQCQIQVGLRSSDAFVLRRCQILLASARGERVPAIALHLGCNQQTVRNAIHAFNAEGLAAQISFSLGIVSESITDETVRRALRRMKTNWKRAKHWITSPDTQYLLKKTSATAC